MALLDRSKPKPAPEVPAFRRPYGKCLNCGTALQGEYCHNCGQRDRTARSRTGFLGEAIEAVTNLDSKIFRTLWPLIFRPGFLSREYIAGRQATYVAPVKMYLNISVVLFVLVSFTVAHNMNVDADMDVPLEELDRKQQSEREQRRRKRLQQQALADSGRVAQLASVDTSAKAATDTAHKGSTTYHGPRISFGAPSKDSTSLQWQVEHRLNAHMRKSRPSQLIQSVVEYLPVSMFTLLPVLALLLWALYFRSYGQYVAHLTFALHTQAFAFAAFMPFMVLVNIEGVDEDYILLAVAVAMLWLGWYIAKALRVFYAQSWLWTLLKFLALFLVYYLLLSLVSVFYFLVAVWNMG